MLWLMLLLIMLLIPSFAGMLVWWEVRAQHALERGAERPPQEGASAEAGA